MAIREYEIVFDEDLPIKLSLEGTLHPLNPPLRLERSEENSRMNVMMKALIVKQVVK